MTKAAPIEDQARADAAQKNVDNAQLAGAGDGSKMKEKTCNLWRERADYRCLPTTGATNPDGTAVMTSAIAKEAAQRFNGLAADLGRLLTSRGNHVHVIRPGLLSFPVQQFAWSGPSLQVIAKSARELAALVGDSVTLLPRSGLCEGGLAWEDVAKVLESLPENIIVVKHIP
ncbi:MAG: ADP-ribose-binding protein [Phycisphaerae bacterium]|nr:ADP-ribose-binding protein [Phycisphaerae bacterium]